MEVDTFERFRELIYEKSGIALRDDKVALLAGRIQKRIKERGLSSEAQYLEIIELDASGQELVFLLDAISTNTTYFWREPQHFEIFGRLLSDWKQYGKKKFRIWCAAASTGQEPYTLSMLATQQVPSPQFDTKILATDISTKVLTASIAGIFNDTDVEKLPEVLKKHFMQCQAQDGSNSRMWKINEDVRQLLLFKRLNLVEFPYPLRGPLDVIFCRNVMIYFDVSTRQKILNEMVRLLTPGGFLFLSLSESLLGVEHPLEKFSTSVYQKRT